MTQLAGICMSNLYKRGDEVLILKQGDVFFGYRAVIDRRMNIVSLDSLESKESNHWKVKIDMTSSPLRSTDHPKRVYASNIQYRDFSIQELALWSKISRLLYS